MVGRSALLHASILLLLSPAVGADRVEDEAGDQATPFPDNLDILAVDVSAAGRDLVVTYETAGDMRSGLHASHQVYIEHEGDSYRVACNAGTIAGESQIAYCFANGGSADGFAFPGTWAADGTSWTVTLPLATFGLGPSSEVSFTAVSKTLVRASPYTYMGPVDVDTLTGGPFRLNGA